MYFRILYEWQMSCTYMGVAEWSCAENIDKYEVCLNDRNMSFLWIDEIQNVTSYLMAYEVT